SGRRSSISAISSSTVRPARYSPIRAIRAPKATSPAGSAEGDTDMESQHIMRAFDRDLEGIQAMVMRMGGMVEAAILEAGQALEARDDELAEKVRMGDKAIDALEEKIGEEASRLIALRAPTAGDLRIV